MADMVLSKAVAVLCSSKSGIPELVDASKGISKDQNFILLLKKDESLLKRFLPSYLNASLRISENCSKSDSLRMEILLFIAGTLRVEKAIKECGASDKSGFIVFANSRSLINKFAKETQSVIAKTYSLRFDLDAAQKVVSTAFPEY